MEIIYTIQEVKHQVKKWRRAGNEIGFVPTMGYLHEGHQSLIQRSVTENEKTVVSIFVNPTQFAPSEDLSSYPRDLQADAELCERIGVDLIFHPSVEEMYAADSCTVVDMDGITKELCAKSRPTHFQGVCTVVNKLFHIVPADRAYFGQKDAQQLSVIKRMVRDFNMDVQIIGCPIVREEDGLAKSSRNTYLNPAEREAAVILSKAVFKAEQLIISGEKSSGQLVAKMRAMIQAEPLAKIDYIEVVNAATIEKMEQLQGSVLVAIAVWIGKTRLIDNFICEV